jgi:hypothetical protein
MSNGRNWLKIYPTPEWSLEVFSMESIDTQSISLRSDVKGEATFKQPNLCYQSKFFHFMPDPFKSQLADQAMPQRTWE